MSVQAAGAVLADRYRLLRRIGTGGMGEVWEAEDAVLQRTVAVKLVRDEHLHEPSILTRFEREAQTAARLVHPGLATVYDYGASEDGVFLVMELLAGETLGQRIRTGPLGADEAADVGAQVADALRAAHDLGVVHRDVKPSNIMLTEHGAKLMDFGIASGLGDPLTATGLVIGTPSYLAPERVRGEGAGPEADVYALGAVLFEALTGERAFNGETPVEVAMTHIHGERPDPSAGRPDVPAELGEICRDAMAVEPAARPTAGQLATRLRSVRPGAPPAPTVVDPTPTPPDPMPAATVAAGPPRQPAPASTGNGGRGWFVVLGLLAVAAIVLAALLLTRDDGDNADSDQAPVATAAPTTPVATRAVPPSTVAPTTVAPTTTAAPTTTVPPAAEGSLGDAAVTYIETLDAGDFETAWQLTTPEFREAQDRQSWEGYWSIYDSIEVVGEPQVDEGSGVVILPLSYDGSTEDYRIELVASEDGRWLVNGPVGN